VLVSWFQLTIINQMTDAVDEAVMMPLIDEETGIVDSTVQAVTE